MTTWKTDIESAASALLQRAGKQASPELQQAFADELIIDCCGRIVSAVADLYHADEITIDEAIDRITHIDTALIREAVLYAIDHWSDESD